MKRLVNWSAEDTQVTISSFARVVEDIEVSDQEQVESIVSLSHLDRKFHGRAIEVET